MKKKFLAMFVAAAILLGMTGCKSDDNDSSTDISVLERELVGLWCDEFEYSGVTEAGVSFSSVLLAVKANADHTGCIYLGVFNAMSDKPVAVYGGPKNAGFKWRLLENGSLLLSNPETGENYALSRRADSTESYGDSMTDVSNTSMSYTGGSVKVTNGDYSGTLAKLDASKGADIEE